MSHLITSLAEIFLLFGSSKGWLSHGKARQEQRVAARLDEAVPTQTRALSHCPRWRTRAGLGVVFRRVHHGEVRLSSGLEVSLQARSESVGYMSRHRHSCKS